MCIRDRSEHVLSKQFQNGRLGTPWASQNGAENLPGTSWGAPGASPGRLQITQSTSSKRSTRPKELPGDPKVIPGAQKTPSGCPRAFKLQAVQPCFSTFAGRRSSMHPSASEVRPCDVRIVPLRASGLQLASAGVAKRKQLLFNSYVEH